MGLPKLDAFLLCAAAVFTDPYWNFVGVHSVLFARKGAAITYDAFVKLADCRKGTRLRVALEVRGPDGASLLPSDELQLHVGSDGCAQGVFHPELVFTQEGFHEFSIIADGELIDVQKFEVILM